MALRLVFMGTPDFAVPTLLEIVGGGHEVAAVYTRAPQPAGRGLAPRESPVAREAARFGLPVLTPKTLRDGAAAETMRAHGADAAVVVAYGLILPKPILDAFPLGCFNLHASLLPRWRGAAPIHRAIMAGDAETGVMVMKMDEGLDTGPIAMAERVKIGPDTTTGELHDQLARLGADLMLRALGALERGGAATDAAAGGRRDLRAQDRQERNPDRLGEAVAAGPRPLPRAVAVSRRVVRIPRRRPRQGFAHHQGRRRRQAGRGARRPADDRLRGGRGTAGRTAARRRQADGVGRIFTRDAARAR